MQKVLWATAPTSLGRLGRDNGFLHFLTLAVFRGKKLHIEGSEPAPWGLVIPPKGPKSGSVKRLFLWESAPNPSKQGDIVSVRSFSVAWAYVEFACVQGSGFILASMGVLGRGADSKPPPPQVCGGTCENEAYFLDLRKFWIGPCDAEGSCGDDEAALRQIRGVLPEKMSFYTF